MEEFISVLKQALKRRGLPRKIYVDNGSAFRSHRLSYACASLGISLIHATPYQPEGKGKCERWFRTVRENFMPQLSLHDLESLEKLNAALWDWIDHYYHQTIHSSTGQTPWERFVQGLKGSRPAPENLEDHFRSRVLRRVGKDRVVSLNGRAFEAPVASIGKHLELRARMWQVITQSFCEIAKDKITPILIIDEASLIPLEVFKELHTLTQFEYDSKPIVSMILAGQEDLIDKLSYPSSRPLASRITARMHLTAGDLNQTRDYVDHHLKIAGVRKALLEESAVVALHQASAGILRNINNVMRCSLITAASDKRQNITAEDIHIASTELFLNP